VSYSSRTLLLGLVPGLALLLSPGRLPSQDVSAQLRLLPNVTVLLRNSGYIFSGTVVSVQRLRSDRSAVPAMQISVRVEQTIRGVSAGQIVSIREWAGLWNAGQQYRPGERFLLFLHPPGRLGLTSLVGGAQGRFPVDRAGRVILQQAGKPAPAGFPQVAPARPGPIRVPPNWVEALRHMGRE
jgi:hypothetical protein